MHLSEPFHFTSEKTDTQIGSPAASREEATQHRTGPGSPSPVSVPGMELGFGWEAERACGERNLASCLQLEVLTGWFLLFPL